MFDRFKVTLASIGAASRLLALQLRGAGDEGDDAGAEPADGTWYQQLGVAARPVVARTLRALGVRLGDEVLVLKVWDKARTPTDLEAGEVRVYGVGGGNAGTTIRVRANGDVDIETGGLGRLRVEASTGIVHLGSVAATSFVALADLTKQRLDALQAAFDQHTHPTAGAGAPSPPTPVPGVIPVGALESVAATRAKVI